MAVDAKLSLQLSDGRESISCSELSGGNAVFDLLLDLKMQVIGTASVDIEIHCAILSSHCYISYITNIQ
jgi:hypothetical protein